jgi:hypothetical protein
LNEKERKAKAEELAATVEARQKHKLEAQNIASTARAKQKEFDATIATLTRDYREGSEARDVDCVEQTDSKRGVVHLMRTDTDEIVETRAMTAEERQGKIPGTDVKPPPEPKRAKKSAPN